MADDDAPEARESPESRASPGPLRLPSERVLVLGILTVVAALFLPTLRHGLVYDDGWTLVSNGFLRDLEWEVLFSRGAVERHVPDAFRPTLVLFDAATYSLIGLRPAAHHAISIVLHLSVCAVAYHLARRLGAPKLFAATVLALFGVLAIHAEAVAVVSFREDLLAALLMLLALVCAERALRVTPALAALACGGAAVLQAVACGAKMNAAGAPLLWLLLALVVGAGARPPVRRLLAGTVALFAGTALALAHAIALHGGLSPYDPVHNPRILASRIGLGPVLASSTKIHVGYLQQLLAPLNLSPEYVDAGAAWTDPTVLASAGLLLALTIAALAALARGRYRRVAFAWLGFIVLALPTSNLFGMPNMRADRFMYLPSLPICVGLAALCLLLGERWAARRREARLQLVPALALVVFQGSACLGATLPYANNATLWQVASTRAPDSARAQALVGLARIGEARSREALDEDLLAVARTHCEEATRLDPLYELPELCHAELAVTRRDWDSARRHYERALILSPDRQDRILASLAQLTLDLPGAPMAHRRARAGALLDRGMGAYPYSPELHVTAARIAHLDGDPLRARHLYRRARSLQPERWETIVQALELALDLGDAAAAQRSWLEEHEALERADPSVRAALGRRLAASRRNHGSTLLQSLCRPGVFSNES